MSRARVLVLFSLFAALVLAVLPASPAAAAGEKPERIALWPGRAPVDKVASDMDRDFWMSAEEALEYGLISKIVTSRSELD